MIFSCAGAPLRAHTSEDLAVLERLIVAGFGGQGVVFLGRLLAQAMMDEGLHVSYFPSYGPEVRGGRAHCHVMISSDEILCPIIAQPDSLIMMNQPSWDFFAPLLKPDGVAVVNSSMVTWAVEHESQQVVSVPATDIASELGDVRATNMAMLGAYNVARKLLPLDRLLERLRAAFGEQKAALFDLNCAAVHRGIEAAAAQGFVP